MGKMEVKLPELLKGLSYGSRRGRAEKREMKKERSMNSTKKNPPYSKLDGRKKGFTRNYEAYKGEGKGLEGRKGRGDGGKRNPRTKNF